VWTMPRARNVTRRNLSTRVIGWSGPPTLPSASVWLDLVVDEPKWNGYTFRLSYSPRSHELTGLEIQRESEAAPLGAQHLQRVPLGTLDRVARRHVSDFLAFWDEAIPASAHVGDVQSLYPSVMDWLDPVADGRAASDDDVRLAQLCRRYIKLDAESGWRETLAHEFNYEPSGIQTIIARARARRFLTPVPRGQYGGQLMPKALRLLAPPKRQAAWDRLTTEQRTGALELDRRHRELEAELLEQRQAGLIDAETFARRGMEIDAEMFATS
jgi:hypothetical protein